MFNDLDDTLRTLLDDAAMIAPPFVPPLSLLHAADKSFLTPDKNFPVAQPTVDLFLYEVTENRSLRDPAPIVERSGNSFSRRLPPRRIDCSYIVTTWSNKTGATKVAEEHLLLGEALLWLSRFPVIPDAYLQGALANQLYPPPTMIAQADPNRNAGEFWTALAIAPRPAFYVLVTVAMELSVMNLEPVVTTRIADYRLGAGFSGEASIQIGARAFVGGQPAPNIWIRIEDSLGTEVATTATGVDGRFTFASLQPGAYTFRAAGFPNFSRPVVVPSVTGEYDLQLN